MGTVASVVALVLIVAGAVSIVAAIALSGQISRGQGE